MGSSSGKASLQQYLFVVNDNPKTTLQSMKRLFQIGLIAVFCNLFLISCNGQTKESNITTDKPQPVDGTFENSGFTYYGIPKRISSIDTSAGWNLNGQKILLTGIVYQIDGKTPAPGVLLYYYQTNPEGKYLHKAEESRSMPPNDLG